MYETSQRDICNSKTNNEAITRQRVAEWALSINRANQSALKPTVLQVCSSYVPYGELYVRFEPEVENI